MRLLVVLPFHTLTRSTLLLIVDLRFHLWHCIRACIVLLPVKFFRVICFFHCEQELICTGGRLISLMLTLLASKILPTCSCFLQNFHYRIVMQLDLTGDPFPYRPIFLGAHLIQAFPQHNIPVALSLFVCPPARVSLKEQTSLQGIERVLVILYGRTIYMSCQNERLERRTPFFRSHSLLLGKIQTSSQAAYKLPPDYLS